MSTEILLMASPGSKRAHETTIDQSPCPVVPAQKSNPSTPSQLPRNASASNNLLSSSRASTPLSSVLDMDSISTGPSSPVPAPGEPAASTQATAKKRKLTFAEKETLRIEKQFKEQQKQEEKARKEALKEAEKRDREEKKRAAAEEKEAKKRQQETERAQKRQELEEAKEEKRKVKEEKEAAKQAEAAAKEEEKRAKEEEKAKKARSQLRLNAFFVKKDTTPGSAASSRRNSVTSLKEGSPVKAGLSTVPERTEGTSDYEKAFPPFFLQSHTVMASQSQFGCDAERLQYIRARLDGCLSQQEGPKISLKRTFEEASFEPVAKRRKLGNEVIAVKDLISKINALNGETIDLTQPRTEESESAFRALSRVPVKYLKYAEDVRPPYIGTYTKLPTIPVKRLCRNPFARAFPTINYDYDSEAEWEEPEEGDNCDSDEEDSEADDEDDDMAGFLDDDEDAPKRRNVMGDMEPVCTDLYWQNGRLKRNATAVPYGKTVLDLDSFKISPLLVEAVGPIDPFSTAYWKPAKVPSLNADSTLMAPPPRVPLNSLLGANSRLTVDPATGLSIKPPVATADSAAQKAKSTAKPFPTEQMDEFKREIEGSDLSKIGLVEVLKKKFPQITGKTIQETLPMVAKRDGKSKDSKWVLI